MSDEAMAALRRAWHSGDGAAMVAAVDQVGFDRCLQWTGDVVHAALRSGAPDADALADRIGAALRHRGWGGDYELADALDDARKGRAGALVELPVDLEELVMLLDAGGEYALGGRIDLRTGEVWPEAALDDALSESDDDPHDESRWLTVWPLGSGAAYTDMVDWAATRSGRLRDQLDVALDGRGASGGSRTCCQIGPRTGPTGSPSQKTAAGAEPAPGSPTLAIAQLRSSDR